MVDARDIAEVAAIELIRRDQAVGKLPIQTIDRVGPDTLISAGVAAIRSEVLGKSVVRPNQQLIANDPRRRVGWLIANNQQPKFLVSAFQFGTIVWPEEKPKVVRTGHAWGNAPRNATSNA